MTDTRDEITGTAGEVKSALEVEAASQDGQSVDNNTSLPETAGNSNVSSLETLKRVEPAAYETVIGYFENHYTPEQRKAIANTLKYDPEKNKVVWKDGKDLVQATYDKNGNITGIKAVDDEDNKVYKLDANASTVKYTEKSKENNSKEHTKLIMKKDSAAVTQINRYIEATISLTGGVSLHRGTHKNKTVATVDGYTRQETATDINVQPLSPSVSYTRSSNKQVYNSAGEIINTNSNAVHIDVGTKHVSAGIAGSSTTYTANGENTKSAYAGFEVSAHGGEIGAGTGRKEKTASGTNVHFSGFTVGAGSNGIEAESKSVSRQTSADGQVIYENRTEVLARMKKDGIAASYVHDKISEHGTVHQNASMQIAGKNINVSYSNRQSSADGTQVENKNISLSSSPEYYSEYAVNSAAEDNTVAAYAGTANDAAALANSASENLSAGNIVSNVAGTLEDKLNLKKTLYSNKPKESEQTDSKSASATDEQSGKQNIAMQILATKSCQGR